MQPSSASAVVRLSVLPEGRLYGGLGRALGQWPTFFGAEEKKFVCTWTFVEVKLYPESSAVMVWLPGTRIML